MTHYWVGVVSHDHVRAAVKGGFCQLNHGREAAVRRLKAGDRIAYYSPRERIGEGDPLQAFTALGEVVDHEPYQVQQSETFRPFRRKVRYADGRPAPIRPLLPRLSFSTGNANWGVVLRRGTFAITEEDCRLIAEAMGVPSV